MFDGLISLIERGNYWRAGGIMASMLVIFLLLLWVSIIDVRKKSITFWKMLLASGSCILMPIIVSLFYTCDSLRTMKWYLIPAIPLWFFILELNIRLNKDKFMGKADVDLLSALLSLGICHSVWLANVSTDGTAGIMIMHFWYSALFYLLVGALIYLAIFLFFVVTRVVTHKQSLKDMMRNTKISIIPMFMPAAIMVPYMVMIS